MPARGRSRNNRLSEASSNGLSESDSSTTATRSTRRGKVPKRYLDEDYASTPTPSKRRAITIEKSPLACTPVKVDVAPKANSVHKEKTTPSTVASTPSSSNTTNPKPKGRPPKKAGRKPGRRAKEKQPWEDEVYDEIYEDYDSDHESDEDFIHNDLDELDEDIEEDLMLENVKVEEIEEDSSGYSPWMDMDPATLPKLELPDSSQDIPLPHAAIFDAIEIYEILRSYHRTLRLTPFPFEDFCAALISSNNSCIMAEVHICLLRMCLKSDDEEQIHYSVTETNNSVNIMFHHLETMTYAEILRQYIEAYPSVDYSVREAINASNYPYVGYESKIVVLLFMCYRFLYSSEYRKVVNNVGKFQNDDSCRVCGKSNGRVVGCTRCDASFHVECSNLNPFPDVLICNLCTQNGVKGVADSLPFDEQVDKEPLRMKPIGKDRHGRTYWFVVRRIIVQSEDDSDMRYYSTAPQLYNLLKSLDANYYEKELCSFIKVRINDLLEQMTLTLELNVERRNMVVQTTLNQNPDQYVEYVESMIPEVYLQKENASKMARILQACAEKATLKHEIKQETDEVSNTSGALKVKEEVEEEESILCEQNLGIYDGRLINSFWSGGLDEAELVTYYLEKIDEEIVPATYFRFGDQSNDQGFMSYKNYYANNDMAESLATRKRTIDKKKYMSAKYSFSDNPQLAFEWSQAKDKGFYGNEVLQNKLVQWTIAKLARRIPTELMHRQWPCEMAKFDEALRTSYNWRKMSQCLLQLDCAIRKTVFVPQWWSGLGQLKLQRNTIEQREAQSKEFQRLKKYESDALSKELDESFTKVNYTSAKYPNTYILRQRGETYRNASKGGMGGWYWISQKCVRKLVGLPKKPVLPILENDENKGNRKARNLEKIVGKLREKTDPKIIEMKKTYGFAQKCYSISCRNKKVERPVCSEIDPSLMQTCYSPICRNKNFIKKVDADSTKLKKGVVGEGVPWPIPKPHDFTSNGVVCVFVLEKKILRQLIKTGGCEVVYIPGFSSSAKSNTLVWNYPAPRPCLDLCWRWMTFNARSLHAVALQLKVLWSSIRWTDMDPEDVHPDRRVVIDMPTHDERRKIIAHKEMGPFGQYERYLLEVEIIPLGNEDEEEEDTAWSARKEREGGQQSRSSVRKRRNGNGGIRVPKAIRKDWIDGVDLKLFEIRDYWSARIKLREEAEKKRLAALKAREMARNPVPPPVARSSIEQQRLPQAIKSHHIPGQQNNFMQPQVPTPTQVKLAPAQSLRISPAASFVNGSRLISRQVRDPAEPSYVQSNIQPILHRRDGTNSMRTPSTLPRSVPARQPYMYKPPAAPPASRVPSNDYRYDQVPSTSRASAGQDMRDMRDESYYEAVQYAASIPATSNSVRQLANDYHFSDGMGRGRGLASNVAFRQKQEYLLQRHLGPNTRLTSQTPSYAPQSQLNQRVLYIQQPVGEPQTDMRRFTAQPGAEGGAVANGSDSDEQPPVIPRYDRNTLNSDASETGRPVVRHVYAANVTPNPNMVVRKPAAAKNAVFVIKRADGAVQNNMIMRTANGNQEGSSSQMILQQPGARVVQMRPGQQQVRTVSQIPPGSRVVRVTQPRFTGGPGVATIPRTVPLGRQIQTDFDGGQDQGFVQGGSYSGGNLVQKPRFVQRGGTTMHLAQQQQMVNDHNIPYTGEISNDELVQFEAK